MIAKGNYYALRTVCVTYDIQVFFLIFAFFACKT